MSWPIVCVCMGGGAGQETNQNHLLPAFLQPAVKDTL